MFVRRLKSLPRGSCARNVGQARAAALLVVAASALALERRAGAAEPVLGPPLLSSPPPAASAARAPEPESGVTPSLYYAVTPGLAGRLANASAGHAVGLDVEAPVVKHVNYHLVLGLATAGGYFGFQVKPLVFGFPIPLAKSRLGRWLLEPCVDAIAAEGLANGGSTLFLSAGAWVQGVLKGNGYSVSVAPIGFQARYWAVYGNSEDATSGFGAGVNWLTRITVGL